MIFKLQNTFISCFSAPGLALNPSISLTSHSLMPNSTLIVIPTYNERENLPKLLEKLEELFHPPQKEKALLPSIDILIVDDNSPDGTGDWVTEEAATKPYLHLLSRQQKDGLGKAYLAGFEWGLEQGYEALVQMDADFSHPPEKIDSLIAPIQEGKADLVIGSRYIDGVRVINWPLRRLILSVGASYYVHTVTGLPIHDPTGGFKCWHRKTLEALGLKSIESNGYGFQIEMNHRAWSSGYRIQEVPIIFTDRLEGVSKMSWPIIIEAFFMAWRLLLRNPLRRPHQLK